MAVSWRCIGPSIALGCYPRHGGSHPPGWRPAWGKDPGTAYRDRIEVEVEEVPREVYAAAPYRIADRIAAAEAALKALGVVTLTAPGSSVCF